MSDSDENAGLTERQPTPANYSEVVVAVDNSPNHSIVFTLLFADALSILAIFAATKLPFDKEERLQVIPFLVIAVAVIEFWTLILVVRNQNLTLLGQFLFGINCMPIALILAFFTGGASILFLLVLGVAKIKSWPLFFPTTILSLVAMIIFLKIAFGQFNPILF